MDEIVVAQNKYISSKRAARMSGYAQDYVGQLVRLGKLKATKVGKSWFVDEAGLLRHINGSDRLESPIKDLAALESRASNLYKSTVTAGISYPSTWSPVTYIRDESPLLPISDNREVVSVEHNLSSYDGSESGLGADMSTGSDSIAVSIRVKRPIASHSRPVRAVSVDGVRFSTNSTPSEAFSDLSEAGFDASREHLYLSGAQTSRSDFFTTVGRTIFAAIVAPLIVFLVPMVS